MSLVAPFKVLFNPVSFDAGKAPVLQSAAGTGRPSREGSFPKAGFAEMPEPEIEASLTPATAAHCASYHAGLPHNRETPLHELSELAGGLGLGALYVKDESWRMGLNAFKALGSTWAVACILAERFGMNPDEEAPAFASLMRLARREADGRISFITASDGNHGRGLALAARLFGQKARVLLPKGTALARLDNILCEGGEAVLTSLTYDECVQAAWAEAGQTKGVLVQDTAFAGYEAVPLRVMQGYLTIAHEIFGQMGDLCPTHVFLQAGVGSFAAAMASCLSRRWDLTIVLVEPQKADCLYRTMRADDGRLHVVEGPMDSIMAGLCCGCPSTLAMGILKRRGRAFLVCEDDAAELGMRLYGHPTGHDPKIVSGESGASTLGALAGLMLEDQETAKRLGLDASSRVLLINTEGDTDPVNYNHVLDKGPVAIETRART